MDNSGQKLSESSAGDYRRDEREYAIRQVLWMLEDEDLDWNQDRLGQELGMRGAEIGEVMRNWSERPNTPTRLMCRAIDLVYRFVAGGPPQPPPIHEYTPRPRRKKKEAAYAPPPGLTEDEVGLIYRILDRLDRIEARMNVAQGNVHTGLDASSDATAENQNSTRI